MGSDWGPQQIVHYHQLFGNKARATPKKKKEHATHTEKNTNGIIIKTKTTWNIERIVNKKENMWNGLIKNVQR